jgi:anti-sigma B factor antagonist
MKGKLTLAVGRRDGGKAVLRVEGSVDPSTFKQFEATFRWLNKQGILHVVVDMARLTYISSSGLSLLVKAKTERTKGKRKGDVVLVRPQTPIVNIMKILGLTSVFRIVSSVDEALHPPAPRDPQ